MIKKYVVVWWFFTLNAAKIAFASRFGAFIFLLGKFIRFFFFLFFLVTLVNNTKTLAGFSLWEIVFFFATFNLIDAIPQFFLREVYRFRYNVILGNFDYYLVKPISPLFRALFGGSDVLDIVILCMSFGFIFVAASHLSSITPLGVLCYIVLVSNAIMIATAFHIAVLALGIRTTEVDNAIMMYRDVTQMGRFPIDIYREPLRGILTFVVPVGIMTTFPAKAIMGLLSVQAIVIASSIGIIVLTISLVLWKNALAHYTSASS